MRKGLLILVPLRSQGGSALFMLQYT